MSLIEAELLVRLTTVLLIIDTAANTELRQARHDLFEPVITILARTLIAHGNSVTALGLVSISSACCDHQAEAGL